MADPPNSYLANPDLFGTPQATWKPSEQHRGPAVAAAYLQHRVAVATERALVTGSSGIRTHAALARVIGEKDPGNLTRKLRGGRSASVTDILGWASVLGEPVLHALRECHDLLPREYSAWADDWSPGLGRLVTFRDPMAPAGASIPWNPVVRRVHQALAEAVELGSAPLLVETAFRQYVVEALIAHGVAAEHCYLSESGLITVGFNPRLAIDVVFAPDLAADLESVGVTVARISQRLLSLLSHEFDSVTAVLLSGARNWAALKAAYPGLATVPAHSPAHLVTFEWHELDRHTGSSSNPSLVLRQLSFAERTDLSRFEIATVLAVDKAIEAP